MKRMYTFRLAASVVIMLAVLGVRPVLAQITYVDATASNTSGDTFDVDANTDNHWYIRSFVGVNDDTVFQGGAQEDCPEITTTVSVANGDYRVYAFFWDTDTTYSWDGAAGLTSGALIDINGNSALNASTLPFNVDPVFTSGGAQTLRYLHLGVVTVSDGTLKVYIDDSDVGAGAGTDHRTWYDGIGYAPVSSTSGLITLFRLDLQMAPPPASQSTQTGWTGWGAPASGNGSSLSTLIPTLNIGVTITATGASGEIQCRGGAAQNRSTAIVGTSWNDVVEDLWTARNGDGNMTIALTGLTPQTAYRLTGWHNDSYTLNEGFAAPVGYMITPSVTTEVLVEVSDPGASSNVTDGTRTNSDFNTSVISFLPDATGAATILLTTTGSTADLLVLSGLQLERYPPAGTVFIVR